MKPTRIALIFALLGGAGAAVWWSVREPRSTDSGASTAPVSTTAPDVAASTPSASGTSSEHGAQLALEIERALVARDPRQRETALMILLPELLETDPGRVPALVARQQTGEARDVLLDAVARQWSRIDRGATVRWLQSLDSEDEKRAGARAAVDSLAASAPEQAIYVADQFGVGRDDGSLEHLVQMWAETDLEAALRWLKTQPDDAKTAPLRARIELVRGRKQGAGG